MPQFADLPTEVARTKLAQSRWVLAEAHFVAIATTNEDGSPHVSPVFMARDSQGVIYWGSHPQALHSQNIARDPKVFMVIYDSQNGGGVFFDAQVQLLEDEADIAAALSILSKQSMDFRGAGYGDPAHFMGDGPQRVYRAVPEKAYIPYGAKNEQGWYIRDERYEVPLADLL